MFCFLWWYSKQVMVNYCWILVKYCQNASLSESQNYQRKACYALGWLYDMMQILADPAIIINSPSNALGLQVKYGLIQGRAYWWHLGGWWCFRMRRRMMGWDKSREWGGNVAEQEPISGRKLSLLKTRPPPTPSSRLDDIPLEPVTVTTFLIKFVKSFKNLIWFHLNICLFVISCSTIDILRHLPLDLMTVYPNRSQLWLFWFND